MKLMNLTNLSASLPQASALALYMAGGVLILGPLTDPTNGAILCSVVVGWIRCERCELAATPAQRSQRSCSTWHSDGRLVHFFVSSSTMVRVADADIIT